MPNDPFYRSKEWHRVRMKVLLRDGKRCRRCGADISGKGQAHIDHIIPRRKAPHLALELTNLQSLCVTCHNRFKQLDEINPNRGCDINGLPLDPDHPWS